MSDNSGNGALSPRQVETFRFIVGFAAARGAPPTLRQLEVALQTRGAHVTGYLRALERRGLVARRFTPDGESEFVPLKLPHPPAVAAVVQAARRVVDEFPDGWADWPPLRALAQALAGLPPAADLRAPADGEG
jgi:SOS-response transcriptional repressor LexA